jgi:hypothetical protein
MLEQGEHDEELILLLWDIFLRLYGEDCVSDSRLSDIMVFTAVLWQFNARFAIRFAEMAKTKDIRIIDKTGPPHTQVFKP